MLLHRITGAIGMAALVAACSDTSEVPVPFRMMDKPVVDKALAIYSGGGKLPLKEVERRVYPVVVHLPKMTCVGLNLRVGMVGGDTTLCFDDESGQLIQTYRDGQ